jgi:hypothetical protein
MEYSEGRTGRAAESGACCSASTAWSALGAPRIALLFDQASEAARPIGADWAIAGAGMRKSAAASAAAPLEREPKVLLAMHADVAAQGKY